MAFWRSETEVQEENLGEYESVHLDRLLEGVLGVLEENLGEYESVLLDRLFEGVLGVLEENLGVRVSASRQTS